MPVVSVLSKRGISKVNCGTTIILWIKELYEQAKCGSEALHSIELVLVEILMIVAKLSIVWDYYCECAIGSVHMCK